MGPSGSVMNNIYIYNWCHYQHLRHHQYIVKDRIVDCTSYQRKWWIQRPLCNPTWRLYTPVHCIWCPYKLPLTTPDTCTVHVTSNSLRARQYLITIKGEINSRFIDVCDELGLTQVVRDPTRETTFSISCSSRHPTGVWTFR